MYQDPEKCGGHTNVCPDGPGHWQDATGRCRCYEDFGMSADGSCVQCPPNSHNMDEAGPCECLEGFFWNDMTQSCFENCTDGYYFNAVLQNCTIEPEDCKDGPGHWQDAAGRCRCTEDYYMGGDETCYPCPPNMHNEDTEGYCECAAGYYFDPNRPDVCIPDCGWGYFFNEAAGNCTCDPEYLQCGCDWGYVFNETLGNCVCDERINDDCVTNPGCPEGYGHWMDDTGRCRCDEHTFMSRNGSCLICPINQNNMDMEGPCECDDGYYFDPITQEDPNLACIPEPDSNCTEGEGHWVDENGRCRCTEDYFMTMDGICSKCGGNQTNYDEEGPCECLHGYEPDPGKIKHQKGIKLKFIFRTSRKLHKKM